MTKHGIFKGVMIAMVLTLAGYSVQAQSAAEEEAESAPVSSSRESIPSHVSGTQEKDGKTLTIEADVSASGIEHVKEATVVFDENLLGRFLNKVIGTEDHHAEEKENEFGVHYWTTGNDGLDGSVVSLEDIGSVEYIDWEQDRSLDVLEEDGTHMFEYGYMSEQIPSTMTISATEASEKAADFLKEYSCMDFQPWNILAWGDEGMQDGYYEIGLQGVLDGIPVSVKCDSDMRPLRTTVCYADEGIFFLQGVFLLSEQESRTITELVPFDDVLANFRDAFPNLCEGEGVEVDAIRLEYFPQLAEDQTFLLKPVWCFACTGSREENYDGTVQEIRSSYDVLYYAENGKPCGVYFLM